MKRREFIVGLGGASVAWPRPSRAQTAMPVIGYLGSSSPDEQRHANFRQGLAEHGYAEGQNLAIELQWANSRYELIPALITEFVRRRVTLILAGGNQAAAAVKAANIATPFVFVIGDDPVSLGLVTSLNKPPANATGVTFYSVALAGKRLELLHELVPQGAMIAMLENPANPNFTSQRIDVAAAAQTLGRRVEFFSAGTPGDLDKALAALVERRAGGFFYSTDPFFNAERRRLTAFAARVRLPAIYSSREYAEDGGLVAYGSSIRESYRQAGVYVGRILKGEKLSDLPVTQPTKFELILNLKTAKALGMTLSPKLLALADEVIE